MIKLLPNDKNNNIIINMLIHFFFFNEQKNVLQYANL